MSTVEFTSKQVGEISDILTMVQVRLGSIPMRGIEPASIEMVRIALGEIEQVQALLLYEGTVGEKSPEAE